MKWISNNSTLPAIGYRIVKTVKDGGLTEKELASIKGKFNKQKGKKKKTEQEITDELWDKKIQKEIDEKGEGDVQPFLQR
ncbi:MAG: hypothetical protein ACREV3_01830 [Gammaproteobacteria bacterium]